MLEIKIDEEKGGALSSILFNGEEMLHQKDEKSWMGQDVNIFPFIARLQNGIYHVEGKAYSLKNHGLIRYMKPKVICRTASIITEVFESNEDTLKQYPFKFKFYVSYIIRNNTLTIKNTIINEDDKTMYYGLGFHPAIRLACNEEEDNLNIDGNYIDFGKKITLQKYLTDERGEFVKNKVDFLSSRYFYLSKYKFKKDLSYVIDSKNVSTVNLVRRDNIIVSYKFNKAPIITIWTKEKYGDFICIEPWFGLPDEVNNKIELKDKKLINSLTQGSSSTYSYSMKFMVK